PGVHGIPLDRLAVSTLVSSVQPPVLTAAAAERVRRAAVRADGLPGRFAQLLWPGIRPRDTRFPPAARRLAVAAEQPAVYGVEDIVEEIDDSRPPLQQIEPASWPTPGELAMLRRRVGTARRLIERGRHAPGERTLRQAIGGLARRGDWPHVGEGALALASCLLKRGRARDAQAAIAEANEYWHRGENEARLIESSMLAGIAWIDLARLDEAEAVLAAALAAARSAGDGAAIGRASL